MIALVHSKFNTSCRFGHCLLEEPEEIKLDNLAVVAFVQDDDDKSMLHAVSVPVESSGP